MMQKFAVCPRCGQEVRVTLRGKILLLASWFDLADHSPCGTFEAVRVGNKKLIYRDVAENEVQPEEPRR